MTRTVAPESARTAGTRFASWRAMPVCSVNSHPVVSDHGIPTRSGSWLAGTVVEPASVSTSTGSDRRSRWTSTPIDRALVHCSDIPRNSESGSVQPNVLDHRRAGFWVVYQEPAYGVGVTGPARLS